MQCRVGGGGSILFRIGDTVKADSLDHSCVDVTVAEALRLRREDADEAATLDQRLGTHGTTGGSDSGREDADGAAILDQSSGTWSGAGALVPAARIPTVPPDSTNVRGPMPSQALQFRIEDNFAAPRSTNA